MGTVPPLETGDDVDERHAIVNEYSNIYGERNAYLLTFRIHVNRARLIHCPFRCLPRTSPFSR